MPQITKAYAILEPTLHQSVTEAGWLDSIKQRAGFGQQPATPAKSPQPADPDVARSTSTSEADDPLGHVIGSIVKPLTNGQSRFVLHLDRNELTALYLKNDPNAHLQLAKALLGVKEGAAKFALHALLEDPATGEPNDPDSVQAAQADLAAAQGKPAQPTQPAAPKPAAGATPKPKAAAKPKPKVAAAPKTTLAHTMQAGYKFSDLLKDAGGKDYTVLLDVPQQLVSAYQKAPSPEALAQMMNHKYYAATISNSRSAKIAPFLDKAAGDLDAEMEAFDPAIIVNYPGAQTIKQAKIEWNKTYANKHATLTGSPSASATPAAAPPDSAAPPAHQPQTIGNKPADAAAIANPAGQTTAVDPEVAAASKDMPAPNIINTTHDALIQLRSKFPKGDKNWKAFDSAISLLKSMKVAQGLATPKVAPVAA